MRKLIISMIVLSAVFFTGCSSSSYPTGDYYPADSYYPSGYYGPQYYGGGYYPPTMYRNLYPRRRPAVIYRTRPQRVIITQPVRPNRSYKTAPVAPQGNWNRNRTIRPNTNTRPVERSSNRGRVPRN